MWHVYQLRSETELLYVGYTRNLKRRFWQHAHSKSWWSEVTDIQSEEFATEDEARQREKELWAAERPKHNQKSPFLTPEESREYHREYKRKPEQQQRKREYERTPEQQQWRWQYERTPERRLREYQRQQRRRAGSGRRWQQTGPGLF